MPKINQSHRVSDHFDMLRGLAALVVLIYHIRYRFFFDYQDLSDPNLFDTAFYAMTAFGHDAVMVFFVLSGFFISASVIRDQNEGRWTCTRYSVSRLSRLYLVLLPGLLLTLFWDHLGLAFFPDHPIYTGAARPWHHDFFSVYDRLDSATILTNLAFLQTVTSPPLGSNEPLWSLSYEFWYYVTFPLLWLSLYRRTHVGMRICYVLIATALLCVLGKSIAIYFPIWLFGTIVYLLPEIKSISRPWHPLATLFTVACFCAIVVVTHTSLFKTQVTDSVRIIDYINGLSFMVCIYLLLHDKSPSESGIYRSTARLISSFSFTLYVVHMPILVFVRALLLPDAPWSPSPLTVSSAAIIGLGSVAYAFLIALSTEANTDVVRAWLMKRVAVRRPGP